MIDYCNFLTKEEFNEFNAELDKTAVENYTSEYKRQFNQFKIEFSTSEENAIKFYDLFSKYQFIVTRKVGSGISFRRFKEVVRKSDTACK